jgi:hypothetical protein
MGLSATYGALQQPKRVLAEAILAVRDRFEASHQKSTQIHDEHCLRPAERVRLERFAASRARRRGLPKEVDSFPGAKSFHLCVVHHVKVCSGFEGTVEVNEVWASIVATQDIAPRQIPMCLDHWNHRVRVIRDLRSKLVESPPTLMRDSVRHVRSTRRKTLSTFIDKRSRWFVTQATTLDEIYEDFPYLQRVCRLAKSQRIAH